MIRHCLFPSPKGAPPSWGSLAIKYWCHWGLLQKEPGVKLSTGPPNAGSLA